MLPQPYGFSLQKYENLRKMLLGFFFLKRPTRSLPCPYLVPTWSLHRIFVLKINAVAPSPSDSLCRNTKIFEKCYPATRDSSCRNARIHGSFELLSEIQPLVLSFLKTIWPTLDAAKISLHIGTSCVMISEKCEGFSIFQLQIFTIWPEV